MTLIDDYNKLKQAKTLLETKIASIKEAVIINGEVSNDTHVLKIEGGNKVETPNIAKVRELCPQAISTTRTLIPLTEKVVRKDGQLFRVVEEESVSLIDIPKNYFKRVVDTTTTPKRLILRPLTQKEENGLQSN